MFTKRQFIEQLGTLITRKRLAEFMGYKDPHSVDRYLRGLDRLGTRYLTADVYDRIMEVAR